MSVLLRSTLVLLPALNPTNRKDCENKVINSDDFFKCFIR